MAKKITGWKTKGMNRDLSVSAFNPEFAFENMNLRLSTNEGNTSLSWVNERGTLAIPLRVKATPWLQYAAPSDAILGIPIGTAVVGHKLVIFTTSDSVNYPDHIYLLWYKTDEKTSMEGKQLYRGNLNFSTDAPIETHVSYEAENIQKVYWTDGRNQPRVINIAASDSKLKKWNSTVPVWVGPGEDDTASPLDYFFDFVPSVQLNENVVINQSMSSGGLFAPGVIQYCFTYINKYAQQSNIVYVSPLYYLAHSDRGASPEDKTTSSFEIKIYNSDKNFDFVRLYSIQRTSLNAEPIVKLLDDLPVQGTTPSEIYSTEIEYSNENTLPRDSNGKIKTVVAHNGSYGVSVTPVSGTTGYSYSTSFEFYAVVNNGGGEQTGPKIMTLQEVIDDNPQSCFVESYHAGIKMDVIVDLNIYNKGKDVDSNTVGWKLKVGNTFLSNDVVVGQNNQNSLVYNFANQTWYITSSPVTETVNKQDKTGGEYITYIDNGTNGSIIDPYELLYVGGKEIAALTMTDKDNTLFLGNITQNNSIVTSIQNYYDDIRNEAPGSTMGITFENAIVDDDTKKLTLDRSYGVYYHANMLKQNNRKITTFKGGETYRFGFQLQKYTGEWSEPIFMNDVTNTKYPNTTITSDDIKLVYAKANINLTALRSVIGTSTFNSVYKKIRPVIVYPSIGDRTVLCQGVLNPTVFNSQDRIDNSPFAQPSWYFRPYMANDSQSDGSDVDVNNNIAISYPTVTDWNNINLDPENYFIKNGYIKNVYVLVADIATANIDDTLKRGYLRTHERDFWRDELDSRNDVNEDGNVQYPFIGAILVSAGYTTSKYIFISDIKWEEEYYNEIHYNPEHNGEEESSLKYIDGITNARTANRTFKFYSNIGITGDHQFYYMKPAGSGQNTFTFKFYVHDDDAIDKYKYYNVVFSTMDDDSGSYVPSTGDNSGSIVRFKHYDALYCESDLYNVDARGSVKQIEIQGARNTYDSPFSSIKRVKSDTQFFIDQSIVTLNSPDIEFDTEVQCYGTEGLKLRIIGAIPITANISAHNITTSSAMLEVEHNHDNNGPIHFGSGELNYNVLHNNVSLHAGRRLVSEYMWSDVIVANNSDYADKDGIDTSNVKTFLVYPWQRKGSLNNDFRTDDVASSMLKTKKESNLLYSINSAYFQPKAVTGSDFQYINVQLSLTENAEINVRLPKQKMTSSEINYYPKIDRVLTNEEGYTAKIYENYAGDMKKLTNAIPMKYSSTSHAVIALNASNKAIQNINIPILPRGKYGSTEIGRYTNAASSTTFWGDTDIAFDQGEIAGLHTLFSSTSYNYLWLGEIYKDVTNRFGGTTKEAVRNNNWLIAGEEVELSSSSQTALIKWTDGDTYYQRYDCLKTYATTPEDVNQVTEILSFMCETHVNIDGRYDRNRGQVNSYNMRPEIFNQLNPVYTQKNNYFRYRQLDVSQEDKLYYPNHVFFTKTKTSGADVDLWTNMTLATTLEMDGNKGTITSLQRFNDQIICLQDTGISQILYNENVQIAPQQGVPIELANSGKVDGKRYLSDSIGCSNKWSVVNTSSGIYFISNVDRNIYLYNGQLHNLSVAGGINSWSKKNIPAFSDYVRWTPDKYNDFAAYYDRQNQDILFINKNTAFAYSEKFNVFTSFYSYEKTPYLCNLDGTGVWLTYGRVNESSPIRCYVHRHNAGLYCNFFGNNRPYWMTLVGNPEPLKDKIFTNIEFRAAIEGDGIEETEVVDGETVKTGKFIPSLPFTSLETWNEYQHGIAYLQNRNGHNYFKHHTSDNYASLKRKFRIWRCDIPRDNYPLPEDTEENPIPEINTELGIARYATHPMDRMRNPWLYLKLFKGQAGLGSSLPKAEIHDVVMTYFD